MGGQQATLLAEGEEYRVHALPRDDGYLLLHTAPNSGILKPLISPATRASTQVTPQSPQRVLGVASDQQRLYVLLAWDAPPEGSQVGENPYRQVPQRRKMPDLVPAQLYVFWLEDGTPLHRESYDVQTDGGPLVETLGEGLISTRPDGIECLEIGLIFDGRRLTSRYDSLSGTELPLRDRFGDVGT